MPPITKKLQNFWLTQVRIIFLTHSLLIMTTVEFHITVALYSGGLAHFIVTPFMAILCFIDL